METLRIVSILLILSMHIYSQVPKEDMIFGNLILGHLINAIGNIGVTCFVLISGYFGIKFKSFRLIQLILITTFYSLFIYLINNGLNFTTNLIDAILYHSSI